MNTKDKVINDPKIRKVLIFSGVIIYPLLYWFDLTGPDDTPSNSKIMYFMALMVSLVSLILFGVYNLNNGGLDTGFVLYAVLVLSFAGGHDLFKAVVKNKSFFTSLNKVTEKEEQEILNRRETGKEYEIEITD